MSYCPKCGGGQTVKNGHVKGRPRWKCKDCAHQFTRLTPRGKPLETRLMCALLYGYGISLHVLARLYKVEASSVLRWVRAFAKQHHEPPKSESHAIIMEPDEMWHYLEKIHKTPEPGKLWIVIPEDASAGSVVIGLAQH